MFKNFLTGNLGNLKPEKSNYRMGAYVTTAELDGRLTTTAANIRAEIDLLGQQIETMRQEVAKMKREHEESKQVETPEPVKKPATRRARKSEVK